MKIFYTLLAVLVLAGIGFVVTNPSLFSSSDEPNGTAMTENNSNEGNSAKMDDETKTKDVNSKSVTGYVPYSQSTRDAVAGKKPYVLFFHAQWCPACVAADAEITQKQSSLPEGTVVFKTDYDSETALKQAYGITMQHTFVFFDKNGNQVEKLSGANFKEISDRLASHSASDATMGEEQDNSSVSEDSAMMEDDETAMREDKMAEEDPAEYVAYSESAQQAVAGNKPHALFFYAPWCPSCRAADIEFTDKLASLPSNTVVFKTDYDSETALKQAYGITMQHTFVFFDKNGNQVEKLSGPSFETVSETFASL